ncbi:MAG: hypothetical protein OXU23_01900 [Candidatus Poribacteria bacterium]|nr:hypothetical protein [Candidatus Poribacteria bacterium]
MFQTLTNNRIHMLSVVLLFCLVSLLFTFLPIMWVEAQRNEATVAGNWTFDDGSAKDSSRKGLNGQFVGDPKSVNGIVGKALQFNGKSDAVNIPDSVNINTGGPYTNRTVAAFFKCADISKNQKQVIYQEGGGTRGLAIYVHNGKVYVGGWNRAEYNWDGAWPSVKIRSNRWHHVALVIRDGSDRVEKDKFEMWLDGKLIAKEKGGQLHMHGNNISIGHVTQKTVYHDGIQEGNNVDWFSGVIDEVIVYNSAFDRADLAKIAQPLSVEPKGKFTTTWGYLKSKRTEN